MGYCPLSAYHDSIGLILRSARRARLEGRGRQPKPDLSGFGECKEPNSETEFGCFEAGATRPPRDEGGSMIGSTCETRPCASRVTRRVVAKRPFSKTAKCNIIRTR